MIADHDIVHVAVGPPDTLETNLIEKVAAIVNKDLYGIRLLLAGEIPRVIAHYDDVQTAEAVAQSLKGLGLVTIVCKDSELREPSLKFRAHTMEFGEGEILFWDKGGRARRMVSRNVFLIVKGRTRVYIEADTTRTKMKFSLAGTVLTGGIPIWRRVKEKTKGLSLDAQCFARLYERQSLETSVEILQDHMDYSFLGAKMAPSSPTNFTIVATKLQEVFPEAVLDGRLMKPFEADDLEINCKLIYLHHLVLKGLGATG